MNKTLSLILFMSLGTASLFAEIDCPSDSSYHIDMRTQLQDGTPNPTYGQAIATGLCGCLAYTSSATVSGSQVMFTIRLVDNEPIRGLELDIHHDAGSQLYFGPEPFVDANGNGNYDEGEDFTDLNGDGVRNSQLGSVQKGAKFENLTNPEGEPKQMNLTANFIDDTSSVNNDYVKVMAYSTSQAQTTGNGSEGDAVFISYELIAGETLPENVTFYFESAKLPGTSANPELLSVVCGYPSPDNPQTVSTSQLGLRSEILPGQFVLHQNYPNPFNPVTNISFDVPQGAGKMVLSIYNILGQKVSILAEGILNPGQYSYEWNGRDMQGHSVASGIYFYELKSSSFTSRKKMLLLQ